MSAGAAGGGGGGASNTSAAMTLANAVVAVQADTRALHQQLLAVQRHLAGLQNSVNSATNPAEAEANLSRLQGGFSAMIQGILKSLQGGISSVIGMLTGGALLAAVAMATQSIVGMAAGIETSVQSFEALTGSAETARDLIAEMNEFAAKTPYRVDEIQAAVKASMLYGFSAKEAMKQVKNLGDISSISGAQIDELTRLYAQMKSMGQYATVGSDFLGMMANRGIMSRKDIASELGISEVALADRMSKGMLKWKQIEPIFQKLTMEGGRFYRGMERQSQTFTGLASTLRDNVTLIGNELGRVFLDGAKRMVSAGIAVASVVRGWAVAIADFNQKSGGMVARLASALTISLALVAVVPRLIVGIRLLASVMNISLASTGWGALIVAVGGLIYLVLSVANSMRKVGESSGVLTRIGKLASDLYAKLVTAFSGTLEKIMSSFAPLARMIEDGLMGVIRYLDANMESIIGIVKAGVLILTTVIQTWSSIIVAQVRLAISIFMSFAAIVSRVFGGDFENHAKNMTDSFLDFTEAVAAGTILMSNIIMRMVDKLEYFVNYTLDFGVSITSTFSEMFTGILRLTKTWIESMKNILKAGLMGNVVAGVKKAIADISGEYTSTVEKIGSAAGYESLQTTQARRRKESEDRDRRSFSEILKDIQFERKYGDAAGAGASGVMKFASDLVGPKDKQDPPGSGGGMLMRAGFVGLDSAVKEMQQILLDEMKGDQQLGVLKDIRDVQKETLEVQKKGMAMGVEEKPAIIGE